MTDQTKQASDQTKQASDQTKQASDQTKQASDQEKEAQKNRMDRIDAITQDAIDGGFDAIVADLTRPD